MTVELRWVQMGYPSLSYRGDLAGQLNLRLGWARVHQGAPHRGSLAKRLEPRWDVGQGVLGCSVLGVPQKVL